MKYIFIFLQTVFIVAVSLSCSAAQNANPLAPAASKTDDTGSKGSIVKEGQPVVLSGSLNVADGASSGAPAFLANQKVAIQSVDGQAVAEGLTNNLGSFSINLGSKASLKLFEDSGSDTPFSTKIYKMVGVVKADDTGKVRGVRKTIVISPSALNQESSGGYSYNCGKNNVEKVGAIKGKVVLEGGASPAGVDVYVPGTSYVAKTDSDGVFVLAFLTAGKYQVRADMDGYGSFIAENIEVKKEDTTVLDTMTLKISKGPQITQFKQYDGLTYTKSAVVTLSLTVKGAIKYKVSEWSDFRNTVYETIDLFKDPFLFNYVIGTSDGDKTIYIRVADKDGLEVESSFQTRLDTKAPFAPAFTVTATDQLKAGYAKTKSVTVMPANCDDISKVYITEESIKIPTAKDFTLTCSTTLGVSYTLSDGEGTKNLYLWSMDVVDQISASATTYQVVLDMTAPTMTGLSASGSYSGSVSVSPVLSERNVSVYYTIDGSTPTKTSSEIIGGLILIGNTSLKVIAIDYAGNASSVESYAYVIDSAAPFLGTISIEDGATRTKNTTVHLDLSANDATYMTFSEDPTFPLKSTSIPGWKLIWSTYSATASYSFSSTTNGTKRVYAKFADDAGNEIGKNGEISATIVLDTVAPEGSLITLYAPESPSGSFDKYLIWENLSGESDVSYDIDVATDSSFTDIVKQATSVENSYWNVSPAFDNPGTYYWRVRARDSAGNTTAWMASGETKKFEIRLFSRSYVPTTSHSSPIAVATNEQFFGYKTVQYGTTASDRKYLMSDWKLNIGSCSECSAVHLYNLGTESITHTFYEDSSGNWRDGYGMNITSCDLDNDGVDDIVVGAPYTSYFKTVSGVQYEYSNAGKVYVYSGVSPYSKLFEYSIEPTNATSYYCQEYNGETCIVYGYQSWPYIDEDDPYVSREQQYTGRGLACIRRTGIADTLVVSSPGYVKSNGDFTGRVDLINYSSESPYYQVSNTLYGSLYTDSGSGNAFGYDIVVMDKFKVNNNGENGGQVLVIGAPGYDGNTGRVYMYKTSDLTTSLATIDGSDTYEEFGMGLFNLGSFSYSDGGAYEELAVRTTAGVVRIYNGENLTATPNLLMAIVTTTLETYSFGRSVKVVGDLNADGRKEIAVSTPTQFTSGYWGSGVITVYDYTKPNTQETTETPVLYKLAGPPAAQRFLGIDIMESLDSNEDEAIDTIIATAPGYSSGRGAVVEFSIVSLSPSQPTAIVGTGTNDKMGSKVIIGGDFDADGTNDFVVSAPNANYIYTNAGTVEIRSGADFSLLKAIHGTQQDEKLGTDIGYDYNQLYITTGGGGSMYVIRREDVLKLVTLDDKTYTTVSGYLKEISKYKRKGGMGYSSAIKIGGFGKPGEVYSTESSYDNKVLLHAGEYFYYYNQNINNWAYNTGFAVVYSFPSPYSSSYIYDYFYNSTNGELYNLGDCTGLTTTTDSTYCKCIILGPDGTSDTSGFGSAAIFVPDMTGDNLTDIAVSAYNTSAGDSRTGKVYIFDGTDCTGGAKLTMADAALTYDANAIDAPLAQGEGYNFGRTLAAVPSISNTENSVLMVSNNDPSNTSNTNLGELYAFSNKLRNARLVNNGVTFVAKTSGAAGNNYSIKIVEGAWSGSWYYPTCSANINQITITLGRWDSTSDAIYCWPWYIITAVQDTPACSSLIAATYTPNDWSCVLTTDNNFVFLTGGTDSTDTVLYTHFSKPAGSQFGGTIKVLDDVTGDGYKDFAISMSKGQGMISDVGGQVIIYDGKKLLKADWRALATQALKDAYDAASPYPVRAELIKFYSPTATFSNYGASLFYSDVTGDGLSDFVIGAPFYSSSTKSSAGEVLIYPVQGLITSGD
ncbi:MAG: FG-GAP repeat protein [Oligoflexales bacterium]|nr:FG-GAP repeat protein [Oligoflexales bacterium]